MTRSKPNILITGTPGCGKTSTCRTLEKLTGLKHLHLTDIIKEGKLYDDYDREFDSYILNEDKLCDAIEPFIDEGGYIVDYHSCDFFGEDWFDLIVVLRTNNNVMYERLEKRGYSEKKIAENIECEIMQVVLDEAKEAYPDTIIVELENNTLEDMESNVLRIERWIEENKEIDDKDSGIE